MDAVETSCAGGSRDQKQAQNKAMRNITLLMPRDFGLEMSDLRF